MVECCGVAPSRNVFARLPSYNPFVGTFHHAPSAGNRGAVYFSGDIVGMSELEERKKYRHHPLTGTFHSLPGYYDPLHRLGQIRHDEEHLSHCDTDSVRSYVAVDLADHEVYDPASIIGPPKSLSRMYSDSDTFSGNAGVAGRPRRFSDSDKEAIFAIPEAPHVMSNNQSPAGSPHAKDAASPEADSPTQKVRAKTLPPDQLEVIVGHVPLERRSSVTKRRKSSSGSTQSTESDLSTSPEDFMQRFERVELVRSVSSTELNDGFISTGKGIFRKVGLRHSFHDRERSNSKPVSPSRASFHWTNEDSEDDYAEEYTQAAPRVPLNPFVARRLTDGDEIRIMAVHRHNVPRERNPEVINAGSDTDDESSSVPKPYFIHERAVTEQYELNGADQLGDGSYAVVKPAIRRANGKEVAIKQIHKRYLTTEASKSAVEREIEIHLRLKHRHIVRLHEVYETDDFLYLVMSKAKKGNLKALMQRKRRLPEALAAKLAQQIVRAVFFLHDTGVLHCDLKPENILLTDARSTNQESNDSNSPKGRRGSLPSSLDPHADVKVGDLQVELCDFGLSVKVPDVRFYKLTGDVHKVPFTGVTGTPGYIAPELLQQQPYGKPVDMWSVGIVIYEMLTGYQPFYPPHACIDEKADFNDRVWSSVSAQAKDLVQGLLESDPTKRLTAADALSHGWFDAATFAL
ncbi:hypothetical protein Poli38472_002368 [Pythium oligandrum]|uniref:Protein kinase domain-containing protein n=1 Tax=Pythium oligandrum TaxID=41045 RepID=A0A8K1CHE0_PYTOL|nr:hypothetical protein Poli38472_002368 [Pythium oligandrum]|eukprot:TMW63427.1 hypothetical protein Poli38472_002368 [Pythium oligandrum]